MEDITTGQQGEMMADKGNKLNDKVSTKDSLRKKRWVDITKPKDPRLTGTIYVPTTQEEFTKLADEFDEWSKLESSTCINEFPLSKDISPYRFKRFDNEYFQAKLQIVKYRVSNRNRKLVNLGECDKDIYKQELYMLDQDYKEAHIEQMTLKAQGLKDITKAVIEYDGMLANKKKDK